MSILPVGLVLVGVFPLWGVVPAAAQGRTGTDALRVARGKYLVENVAVCWRCHTPRDASGEPERSRWLMGASVFVEPTIPVADWAQVAPRLAGLPPGTDEQFVTLMTTGISRTGRPPKPPMPRFRLTPDDAESVLLYLKSLAATGQ